MKLHFRITALATYHKPLGYPCDSGRERNFKGNSIEDEFHCNSDEISVLFTYTNKTKVNASDYISIDLNLKNIPFQSKNFNDH